MARFDTQKSVNGLDVLLPRASFAWKPAQNTRISGGVGIFAGGDPVVWLSNAYQPSQFSATLPAQQVTDLQTIPASLITTVARGGIPARNATIARDFRTPRDVKVSMRLDQKFDLKPFGLNLGTGYRFTAQALYSRSLYGFGFRDINQLRVQQIGVAPDGRPTYANLAALGQPDIVELYNTRGGESWILTAKPRKTVPQWSRSPILLCLSRCDLGQRRNELDCGRQSRIDGRCRSEPAVGRPVTLRDSAQSYCEHRVPTQFRAWPAHAIRHFRIRQ